MFPLVLHYIIWTLTAALYAPVFWQLYHSRWEMIDYTHAYFILPVALWLAWRSRAELHRHCEGGARSNPKSTILSLPLLLLGLFMLIFGWRRDYLLISTLSLIPVLFGLTGYLYGPRVCRALAFPILYLLLLVPPPLGILDSITIPMRYGISIATETILKTFHYPITRDGLLFSLGGHEMYMGAPCSGFRSLITMLSLGLTYAYVIHGSLRKKLILVGSIVPLALLGNLIRIVSVCLVTYYFGETTGARYHDTSGFVIFLILITGLLGIEKLLENNLIRHCEERSDEAIPSNNKTNYRPGLLITILLITTAVAAFAIPKPKYTSPDILSKLSIPTPDTWTGKDISSEFNLNVQRDNFISRIFARSYTLANGPSLTFLILDAGNFHNPKVCLGGSGFSATELPDTAFTIKNHTLKTHAVFFEKKGESYLVIYWITINKEPVDWARQKWLELRYALFNKEKTGLMMRIDIPVPRESIPSAISFAQKFLNNISTQMPEEQAEYVFGK